VRYRGRVKQRALDERLGLLRAQHGSTLFVGDLVLDRLLDEHSKLGALTIDLVTRVEARTPILALITRVRDFHVPARQRAFTQIATTPTVALLLFRRLTATVRRRLGSFVNQRVELALQRLLVVEQVGKR